MLSSKLGGEGRAMFVQPTVFEIGGEQQGSRRSPVERKSHRWYRQDQKGTGGADIRTIVEPRGFECFSCKSNSLCDPKNL